MKNKLAILLLLPILAVAQMAPAPKIEMPKDLDAVKSTRGYATLGVGPLPLLLPAFGVGGRFQEGYSGIDLSGQVATIGKATIVKENISYLYFPKPNLKSQFYVGAGASFGQFFMKHSKAKVYASPELTLGKEYVNQTGDRRFIQAQIDFPLIDISRHPGKTRFFPASVVSYGICF